MKINIPIEIGDTIWIFKRHYSVDYSVATICDNFKEEYLKPIPHKVTKLNFFYDENKKAYGYQTERVYNEDGSKSYTWYCLEKLGKDYFLTEKDALDSIQNLKTIMAKSIKSSMDHRKEQITKLQEEYKQGEEILQLLDTY